jgi:hypothetical protein
MFTFSAIALKFQGMFFYKNYVKIVGTAILADYFYSAFKLLSSQPGY